MYLVSVNTSAWMEGLDTEIRVCFDDDAKAEADKLSKYGENIIEKCFWRLVHEQWQEVQAPSVEFRVSRLDLLGLVDRLKQASLEVNSQGK